MIVTAAHTKGADDVKKYISLGVDDSKQISGKINAIGKEITGITSWKEIMAKPLVSNDIFTARIITNGEYNRKCHENNDSSENVLHNLLKEAHVQVLREVYKKYPDSTIVVDDFTDGKGAKAFKEKLADEADHITADKIFMTTKGDSKLMAISLASVISCYLSNLAHEYAQEILNDAYRIESEEYIKLPAGASIPGGTEMFLAKLKPEFQDKFMNKFSKKYFDNIWSVLKP